MSEETERTSDGGGRAAGVVSGVVSGMACGMVSMASSVSHGVGDVVHTVATGEEVLGVVMRCVVCVWLVIVSLFG